VTYKTILVHLDENPRRADRLRVGFELAERFDAHVVGLFAIGAAYIPSFAMAEAGPLVREIERRSRREAAAAAENELRRLERRAGKSERCLSSQEVTPALYLNARYADLVIMSQPEPEQRLERATVEDVILSCGRPVLLLPYAGRFQGEFKRVMVAWNASREAARALTDALPLLQAAQSVEVVAFEPEDADHGEVPSADIALYLARHGVKASAARQSAKSLDVGSQILSRAADANAELIVMGAYGHSRLRETVLGGATRSLLDSMTVPVLMAH
jgi:nucleotide-binding universal stress UspA family protein